MLPNARSSSNAWPNPTCACRRSARKAPTKAAQRTSTPCRGGPCVTYAGFVFGPAKQRILTESDCFCFPTYYYAESFGLVLVEAMAFGLPVITTRWRSIPELLPQDYPGFVDIRSPPPNRRTPPGPPHPRHLR